MSDARLLFKQELRKELHYRTNDLPDQLAFWGFFIASITLAAAAAAIAAVIYAKG